MGDKATLLHVETLQSCAAGGNLQGPGFGSAPSCSGFWVGGSRGRGCETLRRGSSHLRAGQRPAAEQRPEAQPPLRTQPCCPAPVCGAGCHVAHMCASSRRPKHMGSTWGAEPPAQREAMAVCGNTLSRAAGAAGADGFLIPGCSWPRLQCPAMGCGCAPLRC